MAELQLLKSITRRQQEMARYGNTNVFKEEISIEKAAFAGYGRRTRYGSGTWLVCRSYEETKERTKRG